MQFTVKLATALSSYRPVEAEKNTFTVELTEPATASDLLDSLAIPAEQPVMMIINDTLIAPELRDQHRLTDGDRISVMTPIHAG